MKTALKLSVIALFITLALFSTSVTAPFGNWTMVGDMVYVDDSKAYISASPHTISSSQWVTFNMSAKSYTGNVDVAYGFNTSKVKPTKIELYVPKVIKLPDTTNNLTLNYVSSITPTSSAPDMGMGNDYNVNHSQIIYKVQTSNTTWADFVSNVAFDSAEFDSNNQNLTISWNTTQYNNQTWVGVADKFNVTNWEYDGFNTWYNATNIPIKAGQIYTLRVWMDMPVSTTPVDGKYGFAIKPSAQTFQQAADVGTLYYLDPWFNASWGKKAPILINNTGNATTLTEYQVYLNVTYESDMQTDFDDLRVVNDTSGADVKYFIRKKVDGSYAELFFNASNIPASSWTNDTYFLYHNNSAATAVSDGNTTYDFYENFNGLTKWTAGGSQGSVSIADGTAFFTIYRNGDYRITAPFTMGNTTNYITEFRYKQQDYGGYNGYGGYFLAGFKDTTTNPTTSTGNYQGLRGFASRYNPYYYISHFTMYGSSGTKTPDWTTYTDNAWYNAKVTRNSTGINFNMYTDGTWTSPVHTSNYADTYRRAYSYVYLGTIYEDAYALRGYYWVDNFSVRKAVFPEPTASLGADQIDSSPTPPVPVIGAVTTGNFWVNSTWTPGSGNVTDSYNVNYNGAWSNGSSNTYKNTTLSAHGWHNITVYAYNNSGGLSATAMTNNTQIPNNLPVMATNTIVPATAYTSSTLTSTPTATDADSDTVTYYYLWYKDGVATGNTTSTITNLTLNSVYKVFVTPNDGYGNGTGTNSSEVTVVYRWDIVDVVNGVYAVLDTGIPSNPTISTNRNNSILTTDMQVNWDTISSGTWTSLLAAIDYSYSINMRSAIRLNMGGDYTNTTVQNNALANITTYFVDLKTDPYESDVQWIELNFTNTSASSADKGAFANLIAQRITETTNNRAPIYTIEQVSGLNEANVKYSPIISLNILNDTDFINQEELTLRGNTTKSRLFSGNYTLSLLSQYKQNVFNKIRGTISIDHPPETYSAYIDNGVNHDLILFNNQSGTQNLSVSNATGTFLDTTNDVIRVASGSTIYFNVTGNNFAYIINNAVDRIVMNTTLDNVYGDANIYNQTGGFINDYFDSYIYAGASTDIKVRLSDPTYVNTPLSMVYYGWINASIVQNYTDYKYIIIADKNAAVINSTINRPNDTYIYVAVSDYADNDQWMTNKQNETDWASDNGYNTFIDGIDFASGGNNFSTRFKQVINYVKSKNKKVILNTYTTYTEFATYGDGIMKESAFSRWDGNVNTPTYSWEDMTLEKQRAAFYSSHNLPVILMSFGDVRDYDKMYFDYMAGAVLYGYDGNNSFRYGQPNFQAQQDYPVKPLGTMLESGFTETSPTDWNRMYANGRVHVNPVTHTAWMDDRKTVNNISFDIYLYSGAVPVGDGTVYTTVHQPNSTYYNLTYDSPPLYTWGWRKVTLPISEYKEHGQYDIYFATRPTSGGYNFLGKSNTAKKGINSYYDVNGGNINTSPESAFTWNALPIDNNWMVRLNVDYQTELILDTIDASKINQSEYVDINLNRTIVLNGTEEYNVTIYSEIITVATNTLENVWFKALNGSWVAANLPTDNVTDITSESINTWTETQIDGLTYGVVKAYQDATHWLVKLLFPNNINQEARITEPIVTMQNPVYNITVITPINVTQTSNDGTTLSMDLNGTTLNLNSSADFTLSNIYYIGDKMLFTVSATSGTLNISTQMLYPNQNYNLIVDNSIVSSGTSNDTGWITFANSAAGTHNYEVSLDIIAPANLAASTGNFWINWTWDAVPNADEYNIWINGTDLGADTANLYYNGTYSPHAQVTISVRGINTTTQNYGLWSNLTTTIPNNLPVISSTILTPDPVYEDGTITATPSVTDADGDSVIFVYEWFKDNVSIGNNASTLSGLIAGSSYNVTVVPNDGRGLGALSTSNTLTVLPLNTQYASPPAYIADVLYGQNTVLTSLNTTFANMLAGTTGYITPTFNLNNKGNIPANVSSRFTSFVDTTYGMTSGSTVVPAGSYSLESAVAGTYSALNTTGTDAAMADNVPTNTNENWNIRVIVPSGQAALAYTGIVELTFSDAV